MVVPIEIAGRKVGRGHPSFIIAEAGVNHNGSLELVLKLVEAAHAAKADAVKFQLFRIEEQVSKLAPTADYQRNHTGLHTMADMAQSYIPCSVNLKEDEIHKVIDALKKRK